MGMTKEGPGMTSREVRLHWGKHKRSWELQNSSKDNRKKKFVFYYYFLMVANL